MPGPVSYSQLCRKLFSLLKVHCVRNLIPKIWVNLYCHSWYISFFHSQAFDMNWVYTAEADFNISISVCCKFWRWSAALYKWLPDAPCKKTNVRSSLMPKVKLLKALWYILAVLVQETCFKPNTFKGIWRYKCLFYYSSGGRVDSIWWCYYKKYIPARQQINIAILLSMYFSVAFIFVLLQYSNWMVPVRLYCWKQGNYKSWEWC